MTSRLCAFAPFLGLFLFVCSGTATCFGSAVEEASPSSGADGPVAVAQSIVIPGPLRSFERMAAISQKTPLEKVLPLLTRNVFVQGYDLGKPTEFLILLDRYMRQARELQALAGASESIQVPDCDHAGPLLQILGYRLRSGCGQKEVFLMTSDSERAFLTIDSGFPLTTLEQDLRKNLRFSYPFPASRVPVLLHESDWSAIGTKGGSNSLVDLFVRDPSVARLYWAFSKMDSETQAALQRSAPMARFWTFMGARSASSPAASWCPEEQPLSPLGRT
jgi:hypothetical protein